MVAAVRRAPLSPREVLDIRALLAEGVTPTAVSRIFGTWDSVIFSIRDGYQYKHIQTEEDLYNWRLLQGPSGKVEKHIPYEVKGWRDAYSGFKFCSYGLRAYGRKNICILINSLEFCQHGELCEECCFNYTGPVILNKSKFRYRDGFYMIPKSLTGWAIHKSPMSFICEAVLGPSYNLDYYCHNYKCANIHHALLEGMPDARTRQKAPSDD